MARGRRETLPEAVPCREPRLPCWGQGGGPWGVTRPCWAVCRRSTAREGSPVPSRAGPRRTSLRGPISRVFTPRCPCHSPPVSSRPGQGGSPHHPEPQRHPPIAAHQHALRGPGGGGWGSLRTPGHEQPHHHPPPPADPHCHLRRAEDSSEYRGVLRDRTARASAAPLHDLGVPLTPAHVDMVSASPSSACTPGLLSACPGAQHPSHPAPQMALLGCWLGQGLGVTPAEPPHPCIRCLAAR